MRSFDFGLICDKFSLPEFLIKMFFHKYKKATTVIHICVCVSVWKVAFGGTGGGLETCEVRKLGFVVLHVISEPA